jgi:hypothetical protein
VSHDRYVLDLGELDLNARSTIVRRLAGSPHETFAIGLSVGRAAPSSTEPRTPKLSAVVKLSVVRDDGTLIVAEEAPLGDWVASVAVGSSESFLYRRGSSVEVPLAGGAVTHRPAGARTDDGWGSYFTPACGREYRLMLEVVSANASPVSRVRLVAKGGGWK